MADLYIVVGSEFGATHLTFPDVTPPAPATDTTVTVTNIAEDLIKVTFSEAMAVTTSLKNPGNYTVSNSTSSNEEVDVVKVISPDTGSLTYLHLSVKRLKAGHTYELAIAASTVFTIDGDEKSVIAASWEYVPTKTDLMVKSSPSLYSSRSRSTIRAIFEAISISDEEIGGS